MNIIETFTIRVGLHQGPAFIPFIFTVIIDQIYKSIRDTVPWCMFFADDIVLAAETEEEANSKLEEWREALEGKRLHISRMKIEYLQCDFSGTESIGKPEVTIRREVVACTSKFKYLESVIQSNGEINGDVSNRIQAGLLK